VAEVPFDADAQIALVVLGSRAVAALQRELLDQTGSDLAGRQPFRDRRRRRIRLGHQLAQPDLSLALGEPVAGPGLTYRAE
jgi:hypothetical protein